MAFSLTCADYVDYLVLTAAEIECNGDNVTALDAKTGDGDHWVNINIGFQNLAAAQAELRALPLSDMLKKVGMTIMAFIGGSSDVRSYLAAAKALRGTDKLDAQGLLTLLQPKLDAIMERGKTQPGGKP